MEFRTVMITVLALMICFTGCTTLTTGLSVETENGKKLIIKDVNSGYFESIDDESKFIETNNIPLKIGNAFGFKFRLPDIPNGDAIVIDVVVELPKVAGKGESDIVKGKIPFDRSSSDIQQLFWIFEKEEHEYFITGTWTYSIYNKGNLLISRKFNIERSVSPLSANAPHQKTLIQDNSAFALDLYQALRTSKDNLFLSPYSISTALAMTYAGARGETEKQMQKTMHFSLSQDNLHPAFSILQDKLEKVQTEGKVQLHVANSLWPQKGYLFRKEYLDLVKKNYKTKITALDFEGELEKARTLINGWVKDKTRDKIKELIKPEILDKFTRLVLVNAIYFKGNWASKFDKNDTLDMLFNVSSDKTVKTPMMYQKGQFGYWADIDLQVLEMPYIGEQLSMVVLLPTRIDGLPQLEKNLNVENIRKWTIQLRKQKVATWLPKFKLNCDFRLDKTLQGMGMVDAFRKKSDFSGMDGTDLLYISAVLHKAFIDVNEEGTEAAAATAVKLQARGVEQSYTFRADHPFLFLIQENQTGSILFLGRVIDPTKTRE